MTIAFPSGAAVSAPARRLSRFDRAAWIALACLAAFALSWPHLLDVWRSGTFFDTDDAMRMVQVRDWLAGQAWFDLTAHRIAPPQGLLMHWSRVVDVPLGALLRLFGLVASPQPAERLARIAFPLGCQVLLILAFIRTARVLCGPASLGPALLVIVLDGFEFGQFVAGRVDHHAPQIVLLVTFVGAVAAGLRGSGRSAGFVAAAAMALSLAISLENLPFMAVAVSAAALAWVKRGASMTRFVKALALGIAGFVSVLFIATVPPARYTAVFNDALSLPHLLIAVLGGLGWGWLARLRWAQDGQRRRVIGLGGLATVVGCTVLTLCPGFPASPYAAVDPIVRALWLQKVSEAQPLSTMMTLHPASTVLLLGPVVAGLIASLWAWGISRGQASSAWAFIAAVTAAGLAGACWEVRVMTSTLPLAALGGVWAVLQAGRSPRGRSLPMPTLRMVLALFPFSPVLSAAFPLPDDAPGVVAAAADAGRCRATPALTPLTGLRPGLAFAPIDLGAHLLAYTQLSVIAAPYHRDNAGNRAVIEGFRADPDAAERMVKRTGAAYVLLCPSEARAAELSRQAPASLEARLQHGRAPSWLIPVVLEGTPYRVWRVE